MTPILFRAAARYHLHHPWQLALALLGITLGVAVVVAVDAATASARRAFTLSTGAVSGAATHEVLGGPGGLPDTLYTRLRVEHGFEHIAPVLDRYIQLPDHGGATIRLLGLDPFAEAPFRGWIAAGGYNASLTEGVDRAAPAFSDVGTLLTGRAIVLEAATAARLGVSAGDTLRVQAGTVESRVVLAGVLEPRDGLARRALADLALADIATVQEVAGVQGLIDRIDIRLDDDGARADELRAALPSGTRLHATGVRAGATLRMTRAFETNLTALALVALVFGMFLIYNSVTFSVVQRRPLIGLLRAQGVTRREVFTLIIGEALVLGLIATLLGIAAGLLLGSGLVRLVARTINDLYFAMTVTGVRPGALTLAKGALLGIGATLAAAAPPALEAVRTRPRAVLARAVLERGIRVRATTLGLIGAATALLAAGTLAMPTRSITIGFAALFILILAAALVTPAATLVVVRAVAPIAGLLGPVPRLATRGVGATLSRTAPAIAALTVALAVGIAVTVMIASFRGSVLRWLDTSLPADIYISAPDFAAGRADAVLDPDLPAAIRALPAVVGVSTYRHVSLLVDEDLVRLIAVALDPAHERAFDIIDGDTHRAWPAFRDGAVLVSEPFAYRRGVRAGGSIVLPTGTGTVAVRVAAVFRDYASEHGVIFMDRATYDTLWTDHAVTSLAVFTAPDADVDAAMAAIRSLPESRGIIARSNRGLREATLTVFDRTFVITGVLRLLALLVAFVGVTGALMALQLERVREVGILRAAGLTPGQVWSLVTTQTALMGFAAAALAAPLGLAMAWAMVHVINRRSFGWSFDMLLTAGPFLQALAIGVGAALLAGLHPARRLAGLRPAEALRDE